MVPQLEAEPHLKWDIKSPPAREGPYQIVRKALALWSHREEDRKGEDKSSHTYRFTFPHLLRSGGSCCCATLGKCAAAHSYDKRTKRRKGNKMKPSAH